MIRSTRYSLMAAGWLSICLFSGAAARAATIPRAWVGGHYGLAVPNADKTTTRGMYGITAGAKLGTELGLGVYYFGAHKDESPGVAFDYDLYGIELGYHFEGEANGAFFAGRIGTSKVNVAGTSYSPTNLGVAGGYDYMFTDHLSIGGEASFMSIQSAGALSSFTTLDFLGSIKIWL